MSMEEDMTATGKMTKKKEKEYSILMMEVDMKETIKMI